jgi:hypothetical protein
MEGRPLWRPCFHADETALVPPIDAAVVAVVATAKAATTTTSFANR